eukprot:gb/GEZN01007579.1/.p1 GENE.gb/GEZN01007579.1/~~gb/GEZN01007579.1/.p1  ORF type:complete len:431 (-),score=51.08 gb/GEZN01007579.1/:189-1481(-)
MSYKRRRAKEEAHEEEKSDEEDEEAVYSGGRDSQGRMHGRGTLTTSGGVCVYQGRFQHGMRHGQGKLMIEEDGEWMEMQGRWAEDELVFALDVTSSEGLVVRGPIAGGEVCEYRQTMEEAGQGEAGTLELDFRGQYKNGLRHGRGTKYHLGGGETDGIWRDGQLVKTLVFRYPCRFGTTLQGHELHDDVSAPDRISKSPTRQDPYETKRVYVASAGEGRGEGLFAKVELMPGELVCYYNGTRVSTTVADKRSWRFNDSTIHLFRDESLDVPRSLSTLEAYCGSLGHKSNHSHHANARHVLADHPRFGIIKAVRVLDSSPILQDEEITCNYGFDGKHGYPSWYPPPPDPMSSDSLTSAPNSTVPRSKPAGAVKAGEQTELDGKEDRQHNQKKHQRENNRKRRQGRDKRRRLQPSRKSRNIRAKSALLRWLW